MKLREYSRPEEFNEYKDHPLAFLAVWQPTFLALSLAPRGRQWNQVNYPQLDMNTT